MINNIKKIGCGCFTIGTLPSNYLESLTYEEQLLFLLNRIENDIVPNLDDLINQFNKLDINFDEVNKKISDLQNSFSVLQAQMNNLETKIYNQVDIKLQNQYNEIVNLMNQYQTLFNTNLQTTKDDLEKQIENIELGNVIAYDPTTGTTENVSTVIQNVYDALRNNSITCSEFDALELTATSYDEKEISAYNFDVNGKTFLGV